jgi:hypothetical protein
MKLDNDMTNEKLEFPNTLFVYWVHPSSAMQPSVPTLLPQEKGARFKVPLPKERDLG